MKINFFKIKQRYLQVLFIYVMSTGVAVLFAGCHVKNSGSGENAGQDPKQLALSYLAENKLDEATAAFAMAIRMNPEDQSNYLILSRLYLLQKDYTAIEKLAKEGLKINPDNEELKMILAEAYHKENRKQEAEDELANILNKDPAYVKAYYMLARLADSVSGEKYFLLKVLSLDPGNIVPRLQLAELLAGENKTDSAHFYLQSVKTIMPAFSNATSLYYQKAASFLEDYQPARALPYLQQFHKLMEITPEYLSGLNHIEIPEAYAGNFQFDTNIRNLVLDTGEVSGQVNESAVLNNIRFTDASKITGLATQPVSNAGSGVLAVTDEDVQGNMFLYASYPTSGNSSHGELLINNAGTFNECKVIGGIDHKGQDLDATFADYDNDGYQDLFLATTTGIVVYKNNGDGTFTKIKDDIGLNHAHHANKILFADLDQDGDLDMYLSGNEGNEFFRNNGDGTFTDDPAVIGLTKSVATADMDFGDWDGDGDLDIIALDETGRLKLFNNYRHSNFTDISSSVKLQDPTYNGVAVAFGDYNNDGRLDILVAGNGDQKCTLLTNAPGQGFVADEKASQQISEALKGIKVYDAAFLDFDNDGHQDILIAGVNKDNSKPGVKLFHNDGAKGFSDVSYLLPQEPLQAYRIGIADFNDDGDEDIFLEGPNGPQLLRNDGGNQNNYIQLQLTGLSYGNSRNNRLGIGAQVELKAMDLYQLKTVKSPVTEFGVGPRRRIDAIRIIWPNGVPQTVPDPTRKQRITEKELLKGSCPYLFTWDGKKYVFLKDMLWRSALGMPLAIHGTDTTYAYSGPSKEYLLIPGSELKPKNGLYSLKITEELWEAIYFDKLALVAVDHPDSVNVFADERFQPPPYPGRKLYLTTKENLPISATDGKGNNILPELSSYDFRYVSNFSLGKFQGLVKAHDLILDLGKKAISDSLHLFLRGWVMPTDASINTELTQTNKYKIQPPSLQVINKDGKWQTVIKYIGYPMGRDKMVIVDLSGKFLTAHDRRIRIRTNMQIYWDHVFFSAGKVNSPVRMQDVKMVSADLDYHGYSASYRKGGPYGPYWLDYYHVTKGQKWRDLTGDYTRYGDVLPLLQKADDEYVIANSGDELSLGFDAAHLPQLPKGWTRDFLIYSEGWVKDGDLNTAYGQTVAPLPFHKMPSYPYGKNIHYPADKAHREYREKYNTRKVTTDDFKNAIRSGTFENTSE